MHTYNYDDPIYKYTVNRKEIFCLQKELYKKFPNNFTHIRSGKRQNVWQQIDKGYSQTKIFL